MSYCSSIGICVALYGIYLRLSDAIFVVECYNVVMWCISTNHAFLHVFHLECMSYFFSRRGGIVTWWLFAQLLCYSSSAYSLSYNDFYSQRQYPIATDDRNTQNAKSLHVTPRAHQVAHLAAKLCLPKFIGSTLVLHPGFVRCQMDISDQTNWDLMFRVKVG